MDLEERIDELYAGPLDAFVAERNALAKSLTAGGDADAVARVRGLRKPVVPAWGLNRLAREQPQAVGELADLGERLRAAQSHALSGGDVGPLRAAIDERRRAVAALAREAARILEREGIRPDAHRDDLVSTLEAAAADEEAASLLRSGRLVKPLRPPSAFGEQGLRVLEGGRPSTGRARADADTARDVEARVQVLALERALASAERKEGSTSTALERARRRVAELEAKLSDARTELEAAEAEHRGAEVEVKRLAAEREAARR